MTLLPALSLPAAALADHSLALRLLPAGVLASLLLAVTLILAAAVAGLMAYHYAQARIRERRGFTFDPITETTTEESDGAAAVRAKSAEEISSIRSRIESLMSEQSMRVETQSQHLAQKLDDIRVHMETQDRHVDGLKSELRHEIRRRDSELDDLRGQLASALDAFWKTMPALPEGVGGDTLALPPATVADVRESAPRTAPNAPTADAGPAAAAVPEGAPSPHAIAPAPEWADAATMAPAPQAAALDAPAPAWTDASAWNVAATPAPAPATPPAAAGPPPLPAGDPPAAGSAPGDADDLTIIRSIDEETQRKLYAAGIFHLDEVARWSRADARRIAGAVGVSEETIMHEWIFEAQSVLFDSYQRQMSVGGVPA